MAWTSTRTARPQSTSYIAGFPAEVQERLQALRAAIRAAAPHAQETFSYQMPTFNLKGNLVHFAAFKHHIGLYPTRSGTAAFQEALSRYKGAKGSVQLPHDQPLPLDLVTEITLRVGVSRHRALSGCGEPGGGRRESLPAPLAGPALG
jgi:uncharacterized protein YdhG (YjbR/CyaY superfamily)